MDRPVVIIGAGAIGLSIGWMLACAGKAVTVIDRGRAGRGSTWLSAGMLAPDSEMGFEDYAIHRLGQESMRRWPAFTALLERDAGRSIDYRTDGMLHVATDRDSAAALRRKYQFQKKQGLGVRWLAGGEAREIEPFLSGSLPAAVYSPVDHQVDNRLLADALKAAFLNRGGRLIESKPVQRIVPGDEPAVVLEDGTRVEASVVVLAAGAWSRQFDGLEPEALPLVRPVKGQMLQLQMEAPFELKHVVWGPDGYLAPKTSGRLLLGATMEEMGFDTTVTAGGLFRLLEAGWDMVPGIADLVVTDSWAGLRPGSRDNNPILGYSSAPGIIFATGHYRSGILLAPVTGEEVARLIVSGETSQWLQPFSPLRFAHLSKVPPTHHSP